MPIYLQVNAAGARLLVDYLTDSLLVGGVVNCDANAAKRGYTWHPLTDCPSVLV